MNSSCRLENQIIQVKQMFLFLIFKDLRARKTNVGMIKNTSQCHRTHPFVFAVEQEGCFVKQSKTEKIVAVFG